MRLMVKDVAKALGTSENFVRCGLRQGALPWGYAVKTSSKHTYWISAEKFKEDTGIDLSKDMEVIDEA